MDLSPRLADLRAHVAECGLGPLAGLHRGMRDWLKNVRALQEAVEVRSSRLRVDMNVAPHLTLTGGFREV